eukprot:TRINITY_DN2115_c0_g1_i6.p1 TRINITY_DN2115_c0_g1~~TRINITY_DN2115_c0_g1_i6.p1  ORF type:complete len:108 (-),score=11.18 TRINITY_DN2115_c0_g1_i6:513-800(-)
MEGLNVQKFAEITKDITKSEECNKIVSIQENTVQNLLQATEGLHIFNQKSQQIYNEQNKQFEQKIKLLEQIKSDLKSVSQNLEIIKTGLDKVRKK